MIYSLDLTICCLPWCQPSLWRLLLIIICIVKTTWQAIFNWIVSALCLNIGVEPRFYSVSKARLYQLDTLNFSSKEINVWYSKNYYTKIIKKKPAVVLYPDQYFSTLSLNFRILWYTFAKIPKAMNETKSYPYAVLLQRGKIVCYNHKILRTKIVLILNLVLNIRLEWSLLAGISEGSLRSFSIKAVEWRVETVLIPPKNFCHFIDKRIEGKEYTGTYYNLLNKRSLRLQQICELWRRERLGIKFS